jgi:glycosyltransferase involved in cell wall biosynthesis
VPEELKGKRMNQIKVSVIVPVYNVENYIEKCLYSLVTQTLSELEILVVNDGSKDNSDKIIARFVAQYPERIKVLVKENGGLSDARNFGMCYAEGEYIGFVDSDDYVDPEMYEVMYAKAKEGDYQIVECNLHHTFADYEDTEIGEQITEKKKLLMEGRSVVWNKIYKRDWLESTGVNFHKGIIYEDVEFFLKLIPHIERYAYVEPAFVHYVQRESSINHYSSEKTLDILKVLQELKEYYQQNGYFEEYEEALEYFFTRIILCSSFSRMCGIENLQQRKKALKQNYRMLKEHFPNWKKNKYLRANRSGKGFFMKSITPGTYCAYSVVIPVLQKIGRRKHAE